MKPLIITTHDGTFHPDDVFACATLSLVFNDREIEIERSREQWNIDRADIVVDVGGNYDPAKGRFDHHQIGGAGVRDNGIPYASFGLVWKEYGHMLMGSESAAKIIDEQLVQGIDGADNGVIDKVATRGVYVYSIIDMLIAFRPTWQEEKTSTEAFMEAVNAAVAILTRIIAHTKSYTEAQSLIEQAYQTSVDKQIIDIGYEYPGWYEVMSRHPEPLFVVYQREDGNFSAKGVRKNPLEFKIRREFPESWAGLRDRQLQEMTGVHDAIFCHTNRFIVVARSKESIFELARKAISP